MCECASREPQPEPYSILPLQSGSIRQSISTVIGGIGAEQPGKGYPYGLCGTVKGVAKCSNPKCKSPSHLRYHNCGRWDCPKCYMSAVARGAKRISGRLNGMYKAYLRKGKYLGKGVRHYSWNANPDIFTEELVLKDGGKALHKEFINLLKSNSVNPIWGGVWVRHYYRIKHKDGAECETKNCKRDHIWVWGPHYHFLGYAYFTKSNVINTNTGGRWNYRQLGLENAPSKWKRTTKRSLYHTAHYQLSHATRIYQIQHKWVTGFDERKESQRKITGETWDNGLTYSKEFIGQTYGYVGCMANCKGGKKVEQTIIRMEKCVSCKAPMRLYYRQGGVIEEEFIKVKYQKIIYYLARQKKGPPLIEVGQ